MAEWQTDRQSWPHEDPGSRISVLFHHLVASRDALNRVLVGVEAAPGKPGQEVWSHLKRSPANLAKRNLAQLNALVKTRLRQMQYRPSLLEGFLASTGLDRTPFGDTHH